MPTVTAKHTRRQFFNLWLTLLLIWLVANNSLAIDVVVVGIILADILALAFVRFSNVYADIRWSPRVLLYVVAYLLSWPTSTSCDW